MRSTLCTALLPCAAAFLSHGSPFLRTIFSSLPTSTAPRYSTCLSADRGDGFNPAEWDARRRLAQNLSISMKPPGDPLGQNQHVKGWEEEERALSDAEIARRLSRALRRNRNVERATTRKIVNGYFAEGTAELLKEGERLKEEFEAARPRLEAEARERTAVAEGALLSDIDRMIRDFREKSSGITAPLNGINPPERQVVSRGEAVAAGLDKLLASSGSGSSGGGISGRAEVVPGPDPRQSSPLPPQQQEQQQQVVAQATPTTGADSELTSVVAAAAAEATAAAPVSAPLRQPGTVLLESVQSTADSDRIVVVGSDGLLGAALLARIGTAQPATGLELAGLLAGALSPEAKEALATCRTLFLVPADQHDGKGAKKGGFGGAFGALLGGAGAAGSSGSVLTERQVEGLLEACGPSLRHVVVVSSIGVNRIGEFPFSLQNVGGALDAKRGIEQAVVRRANRPEKGFDHTVLRTGKLVAAEETAAAKPVAQVLPGDQGGGNSETARDAAVEGLFQCLVQPAARNASASLLSAAPAPAAPGNDVWRGPMRQKDWDDEFLRLEGPEILRIPLAELMPRVTSSSEAATRAGLFLREWSNVWSRPGTGLTTPVAVLATERSVTILFKPTTQAYVSRKEEQEMEKKRQKEGGSGGGGGGSRPGKREGGLEIFVDELPYPRVRVRRAPMDEGVVVKEMSEKAILERLQKDLKALGTD